MNTLALGIAELSTSLATSKTMTDVNVAVLKKQMQAEEDTGVQLVKMMENSVTPNLGANIDVRLQNTFIFK